LTRHSGATESVCAWEKSLMALTRWFAGALVTMVLTGLPSAPLAQQRGNASNPRGASATQVKKLTRADVDALLAQPARVLLLDVRRPDELTAIGGFPVYLSIQSSALEQHVAAIPRDRLIVTVSNHANRALRAAELLVTHGFNVVGAIGAQDYESEGGRLSKVEAPAPPAAAAPAGR